MHINLKIFIERNLCKDFILSKVLKTSGMLYPRRINSDVYRSELIDNGDEIIVSIVGDIRNGRSTVWDIYFLKKDIQICVGLVDAING